jgi:hypothetical protein
MTLIGEFSRGCVAIYVARRINAIDVIETLADVIPRHLFTIDSHRFPAVPPKSAARSGTFP